jgi:membrane protease YdiL (CAAX protease family)
VRLHPTDLDSNDPIQHEPQVQNGTGQPVPGPGEPVFSPGDPTPSSGHDPAVVDLVDVAMVTGFAFFAMILCTFLAVLVYSAPGIRHINTKGLAHDAFFVIPTQAASYLMVVGFMVFIVWTRHRCGFLRGILWNMPGSHAAVMALGGGVALAVASQLFSGLLHRWIPKTLPIEQFFKGPASGYLLAAFGIFVAPLVEEFFFRGFLYPALARWTGVPAAIVLTAIGFSLIHGAQLALAWAPLMIIFGVGLVLTIVRARTRSVATSMLIHMGYNATLFTMLFFATEGFRHMERMN